MVYGRSLGRERNFTKKSLYNQLDELEKQLSNNPNCQKTCEKYSEIKHELELIMISETEGARIRSGQKWIEDGEKCTKFFLNLEKHRSQTNTIFKITNQKKNESITNCDEILEELANHFRKA